VTVVGADVWKKRWIAVVLDAGRFDRAFVEATIEQVIDTVPEAAIIAVDMPIGLPQPGQRRLADDQARTYVGPQYRSVFPTPPRVLLEAASHASACEIARRRLRRDSRSGLRAGRVHSRSGARRGSRRPRLRSTSGSLVCCSEWRRAPAVVEIIVEWCQPSETDTRRQRRQHSR
jgi:hypothetical protein